MNPFRLYTVLLICAHIAFSQQDSLTGSVRGLVVDGRRSNPLSGANIIFEGTVWGTSTGQDGTFEITGLPLDTLHAKVSYIGYRPIKVKIVLQPDRPNATAYFSMYQVFSVWMDKYKTIPPQWKKNDANGNFTFFLPPDFKKDSQGGISIDSYSERFVGRTMKVAFDFGYGVDFGSDLAEYYEFDVIVGCKEAVIKSFRNPDKHSEYPFITAIDFGKQRWFTLWVSYQNSFEREIALKILNSVQFP